MRTLLENLLEDLEAMAAQSPMLRVGGRFVINDIQQAIAEIEAQRATIAELRKFNEQQMRNIEGLQNKIGVPLR